MIEVFIASIANFITRAFPFVLLTKIPKKLKIYELYFPSIVLTVLIMYIVLQSNIHNHNIYINQFIGIFSTIILHLKFRHYLISIFGGTFLYVCLENFI